MEVEALVYAAPILSAGYIGWQWLSARKEKRATAAKTEAERQAALSAIKANDARRAEAQAGQLANESQVMVNISMLMDEKMKFLQHLIEAQYRALSLRLRRVERKMGIVDWEEEEEDDKHG